RNSVRVEPISVSVAPRNRISCRSRRRKQWRILFWPWQESAEQRQRWWGFALRLAGEGSRCRLQKLWLKLGVCSCRNGVDFDRRSRSELWEAEEAGWAEERCLLAAEQRATQRKN